MTQCSLFSQSVLHLLFKVAFKGLKRFCVYQLVHLWLVVWKLTQSIVKATFPKPLLPHSSKSGTVHMLRFGLCLSAKIWQVSLHQSASGSDWKKASDDAVGPFSVKCGRATSIHWEKAYAVSVLECIVQQLLSGPATKLDEVGVDKIHNIDKKVMGLVVCICVCGAGEWWGWCMLWVASHLSEHQLDL